MRGKIFKLDDLADVIDGTFELYAGYEDTIYLGQFTIDDYPREYGDCDVARVTVENGQLEVLVVVP